MKKIKIFSIPVAFLAVAACLISMKRYQAPVKVYYSKPLEKPISLCGSIPFDLSDSSLTRAELLPGLGNLHYPVTTTSLEAQKFFEQGLRLVYAFNHWEAIRSFREAIRLDPEFAMGYWGLALAYGPNLNDVNPKDRERIAFESIEKAKTKKGRVSQVEKDLIDALATRYDGKAYDVRDSLNLAYAKAMQGVIEKHPSDPEALTLCADAIMNTMPWDYWQADGTPKPATAEAKKVLEQAIAKFPTHPGAHHLYIHLVEASKTPELALNSAKVLETSMPGAGHIVHMPAHIYMRVGEYGKAVDLNVLATKVDEDYLALSDNQGMYRMMYYPHNVDFVAYGSYMEGRSRMGIDAAMKLAYKGNFISEQVPGFAQYLLVEPMIAFTRFGKWNDILSLPDPGNQILYAQVMWRFSRGLALLRSGKINAATFELAKLDSLNKLDTLKSIYITFNPVASSSNIATNLLRGEIMLKQNKADEAIAAFREAIKTEDGLRYNEPPDWKIPARHFLGAALIETGRYAEAEKVYQDDLMVNRENGWSLTGLQRSQHAQGKKSDVTVTAKRFNRAWKNADVALTSSRF